MPSLTPKISNQIGIQAEEQVRDRIAEILRVELSNQAALQSNPQLNATVTLESVTPESFERMPIIRVFVISMNYEELSIVSTNIDVTVAIDIHTNGRHELNADGSVSERGDSQANIRAQRLASVITRILTASVYNTLAFDTAAIRSTRIRQYTPNELEDNRISESTEFVRLEYEAAITFDNITQNSVPLNSTETQISSSDDNTHTFTWQRL